MGLIESVLGSWVGWAGWVRWAGCVNWVAGWVGWVDGPGGLLHHRASGHLREPTQLQSRPNIIEKCMESGHHGNKLEEDNFDSNMSENSAV